jgi:prepilin signal peptidase PulO-like enzyme (type II secretory pathway)
MLLSSFFAAVYGITLMVIKRAKGKTEIPFGPFIAFAVLVCMFAGDRLINIYLSLISK